MLRAHSTVVTMALLLAAGALSGCFGQDAEAPAPRQPDASSPPPADDGRSGGADGGSGQPRPAPQDFTLSDADTIQGPFEKTWTVRVSEVGFRAAHVHFALEGAEAGVPPTARVYLELVDPSGAVLKSALLGVDRTSLDWPFGPADLPTVGDYTLRAAAEPSDLAGVPSFGVAKYRLEALVDY